MNNPQLALSQIIAELQQANLLHSFKEKFSVTSFSRVITDSRQLQKNDLFVALVGEQNDGHQFIPAAIERHPGAILCSHSYWQSHPELHGKVNFLPVSDTLAAYRILAKLWRSKFSLPLLAICGAAGKTTTKEFTAALYRGRWGGQVMQTLASQNGFTGIPATLFRLENTTAAAIVEIGIDEPGAMEQHLEIAMPTAGIITSIGPEHLEKLINVETVAEEECKLFSYLVRHGGKLAINADDPILFSRAANFLKSDHIFYAIENHPCGNFLGRALLGKYNPVKNTLDIQWRENKELRPYLSLTCPLEGKHNAQNLLGAVALATLYGLSVDEIQKGLATFTPPEGRGHIQYFNGAKLFCDTYNANPISMGVALEFLRKKSAKYPAGVEGKTWAVLGDMLELGTQEKELHSALAEQILSLNIDQILLYGPRMAALADSLKMSGHSATQHFTDQNEIIHLLKQKTQSGDSVLLKGSRGMRMENIWKALTSIR